jgi:hypothetical protein
MNFVTIGRVQGKVGRVLASGPSYVNTDWIERAA